MTVGLPLTERIDSWFMSLEPVDDGKGGESQLGIIIESINTQLRYLADQLYVDYEPTRGPHPDFWQRLEAWLDNLDDETRQQYLFRLLPHIFFAGPRELESLYRTAFNHQIATWLIDQLNLAFDDAEAQNKLHSAVASTWFCPVTDSMRINQFYHLNRIEGRDHRPDWRCLARFGDKEKISQYISQHRIERIVLIEDFVGNGSQIRKGVEFAANLQPKVPVLVVPLIVCPAADTLFAELQGKYPHVAFSPCLRLPESEFLTMKPIADEKAIFAAIREISESVADRMREGFTEEQLIQVNKYVPFGWHGTGALVVLHTNCPNNTLPIIFHECPKWKPLFPRASRL